MGSGNEKQLTVHFCKIVNIALKAYLEYIKSLRYPQAISKGACSTCGTKPSLTVLVNGMYKLALVTLERKSFENLLW